MTLLQSNSQRRNKLYPLLFLGLGIVLIAGSVYFLFQNIPSQTDLTAVPVEVNYSAPALSLTDIHGQLVSLADLRGQVILVNLWATWCPPCKKEMPELESFYNKHKDDGFTIVAVNDGDPRADVVQFVKDYRLTFPIWLDPAYIATERAFKTLNLPSSYVINREGKVVLSWLGGINRKNLEKYVTPVIEEQP
jgi:cytochrome c biogenesis protein CcmG/thiol:disulfide interchange protein DsbE